MDDNSAVNPTASEEGQYLEPRPGDPVAPQRTSYWGWGALFLLLFLLVGGELVQYFGRDTPGKKFTADESTLTLVVGMRRFEPTKESPVKTPDKIVAAKSSDPSAARVWAVYEDLQKKKIKAEDLKALTASKDKKDQEFAKVFTSEKLSEKEATDLQSKLGSGEAADYAKLRAKEKAGLPADWTPFTRKALAAMAGVVLAVGACAIGCVLIALYLGARSKGQLEPLGHPALPMSQLESDAYASRVVIFLLLLMLLPAFIAVGLRSMGLPGSGILGPVAVISLTLWISRKRIGSIRFDRWTKPNAVKGMKAVGAGLLIYLMGLPIIAVAMILGSQLFSFLPAPEHPATKMIPEATGYQMIAIFIAAAIQAPIVEEITFRGTLLPAMQRLLNRPVAALIVANLIFAAIHPTGIPAWPALAMVGIVASFAVHQTGSLLPAIAIHAIHNGTLVIFASLISR